MAAALVLVFESESSLGDVVGLPRFARVSHRLYRSGQPSEIGLRKAAAWGVRTVIDLCSEGKRARQEKALVESLGMRYVNIPMSGLRAPTQAEVERVLELIHGSAEQPVLVHCRRGSDRTGVIVAAYRIRFDRWGASAAYDEMRQFGFRWFLAGMKSFVYQFARRQERPQSNPATAMSSMW
jgi:protein tyrosine/serine phosphatase